MIRFLATITLAFTYSTNASAGSCDWMVRKVATTEGESLVKLYRDLIKCDRAAAETTFDEFMRASKDLETLLPLTLLAIDQKIHRPVWEMIDKLPYEVRDDLAYEVGAACSDRDQVIPFLQGAFYGLRAPDLARWSTSFQSCPKGVFVDWLEGIVREPPAQAYDEKYNTALNGYVKQRKIDALPVLVKAAIVSADKEGPFNAIVEKMGQAAQPTGFGATMSTGDRTRLEESMIEVAKNVGQEKAAVVADRLSQLDSEKAAASLLPVIFPERVKGGRLEYGTAAVEACDGQAIIHWSMVSDPAKRWWVLDDVEAELRTAKAKLKCETEGEWPTFGMNEPASDRSSVDDWLSVVTAAWTDKGFKVKTKEEKAISLN